MYFAQQSEVGERSEPRSRVAVAPIQISHTLFPSIRRQTAWNEVKHSLVNVQKCKIASWVGKAALIDRHHTLPHLRAEHVSFISPDIQLRGVGLTTVKMGRNH